ncbi:MAG: SDR family oxidoreductase [Deltaproteobacteria bacterium]|nr:SDR family oxidoreductase [Deltaproteobacteria bacterium]
MTGSWSGEVALVTGFPTLLARRLALRLLADDQRRHLRLLVREKFLADAERWRSALGPDRRKRVELLEGDAASMDLGLSGAELNALSAEVDVIHHAAAITYEGADERDVHDLNVGSAREVVELARASAGLRRLVLWSTTQVSGDHQGVFREDDLELGQRFRSEIERTRHRAEQIVRLAGKDLPVTILRPSIVVGDSQTGETDRLDGPYLLIVLMLTSPPDLRIPLPAKADAPLHVVPLDFVVDAGAYIAEREESIGRTYHLVDPAPRAARVVFEAVARAANRRLPRGFIPANLTRALLRTPGLERFARSPRAFVDQLATNVTYPCARTEEILKDSGIACPPFESYVDAIVGHVRERLREQRETHEVEVDDPLG